MCEYRLCSQCTIPAGSAGQVACQAPGLCQGGVQECGESMDRQGVQQAQQGRHSGLAEWLDGPDCARCGSVQGHHNPAGVLVLPLLVPGCCRQCWSHVGDIDDIRPPAGRIVKKICLHHHKLSNWCPQGLIHVLVASGTHATAISSYNTFRVIISG